jgi:hypothetical protein
MAAENENIPMAVDGEANEEDFTADAAAEAIDEAFDVGDFPTAAGYSQDLPPQWFVRS